jgi:hypothetical protein
VVMEVRLDSGGIGGRWDFFVVRTKAGDRARRGRERGGLRCQIGATDNAKARFTGQFLAVWGNSVYEPAQAFPPKILCDTRNHQPLLSSNNTLLLAEKVAALETSIRRLYDSRLVLQSV